MILTNTGVYNVKKKRRKQDRRTAIPGKPIKDTFLELVKYKKNFNKNYSYRDLTKC